MAQATPALLLGLLLTLPMAATADEISDQITTAKTVYETGDLRKAVQELQYAMAQIQEQINDANTTLVPGPLPGWSAGETQSQSGGFAGMTGTTISRDYSSETEESVSIQIMADSPLMQAMSMMLNNPMLMQMSPGTRMYRHQGHNGMIKHDAGSDSWEITLMMQGRILIQVSGQGLSSKQPVIDYLKAIDLKAVEAAFAG